MCALFIHAAGPSHLALTPVWITYFTFTCPTASEYTLVIRLSSNHLHLGQSLQMLDVMHPLCTGVSRAATATLARRYMSRVNVFLEQITCFNLNFFLYACELAARAWPNYVRPLHACPITFDCFFVPTDQMCDDDLGNLLPNYCAQM